MHLLQFPLCQRSVTTGSATSSSCTGTEKVLHTLNAKVKTGPYVFIVPQGYQQTCCYFLPSFFAQLFCLRHSPFPVLSIFYILYWQTTIQLCWHVARVMTVAAVRMGAARIFTTTAT